MTKPVGAWLRDRADRSRVVEAPQGGKYSGRYDLRFDDGKAAPCAVEVSEPALSDGSGLSVRALRAREAQLARMKGAK